MGWGESLLVWAECASFGGFLRSCKKHPLARRPGGYRTYDMDSHGRLSLQVNCALGHCKKKDDDRVQSHHTIQQEWAKRNIKGY